MIVILSSLGVIILIAGLVGTLALGGAGDSNYDKSTKDNVTRLTFTYIVLFLIVIIGFVIYLNFN